MRVETPQILWHSEEDKSLNAAINGVSLLQSGIVDPTEETYGNVLATGGNSDAIHLWKVNFPSSVTNGTIFKKQSESQTKIELLCSLTRPDSAVHAVSFSPDGLHLAAGLTTGSVLIWSVPHAKRGNGNGRHFWSGLVREQDLIFRLVQVASDNISDISWSSESIRLVVGSIDGVMSVVELQQEENWRVVFKNGMDHSHYVQGVSYDPTGVYLTSMSSDRSVRVYSRKTPKKKKKKGQDQAFDALAKLEVNMRSKEIRRSRTSSTGNKNFFCDEGTLNSFARRLAWTPDGAFLITPAALHGPSGYATLLFARHCYDEPYRILGGLEKPSLAVRPNPVLFELPDEELTTETVNELKENQSPRAKASSSLSYRSIFCVLTWDTVLIYDTYHKQPLSIIRGLHYAHLMDATWSQDGHVLFVCSNDGYVSIIRFEEGELGKVYMKQSLVTKQHVQVAPKTLLPPCEPGPVAVLQTRPKKKVKLSATGVDSPQDTSTSPAPSSTNKRSADEATAGVNKLSLGEMGKKRKKRVQPILLTPA